LLATIAAGWTAAVTGGVSQAAALTEGFQRAFAVRGGFALAGAGVALTVLISRVRAAPTLERACTMSWPGDGRRMVYELHDDDVGDLLEQVVAHVDHVGLGLSGRDRTEAAVPAWAGSETDRGWEVMRWARGGRSGELICLAWAAALCQRPGYAIEHRAHGWQRTTVGCGRWSEGAAESSSPVAEDTECVQRTGGRSGTGEQAQVGGGGDRSRHAGLVREADDAIGVVLDELVERVNFRFGESGPVLDQHSAVKEGVRGGVDCRRGSADIRAVGGDRSLHEGAGHRRVGDAGVLVFLQPASRLARDVSQRVPGRGRPGIFAGEGEADRAGREAERENHHRR
jgi:hypothetical protein